MSLLPKGASIGRPPPGATPQQYASVVQGHVKNWTIAGTITGQICAQIPTVVKGCATGAAGISNNGVAGCASFELPGSQVLQSIAINGAKAINAVARFGRDAGEKLKGVFAVFEQKAKEAGKGAKRFFNKVDDKFVNIVYRVYERAPGDRIALEELDGSRPAVRVATLSGAGGTIHWTPSTVLPGSRRALVARYP